MSRIKDFEFGESILIKNKLKRRSEIKGNEYRGYTYKYWYPTETEESEGIFLGKRSLSNGKREMYSDHIEYRPDEYIDAALVATGPNSNPFYSTHIEKL